MNDPMAHEITTVDPESASPDDVSIETLRSGLESDENLVRTHASKVLVRLADLDYESVMALLPTMVDLLDDERTIVVNNTSLTLSFVAEEEPARVEPAIEALVGLLDEDPPVLQLGAARVFRRVLVEEPRLFLPVLDDLVERVVTEQEDPVTDEQIENADAEKREMLTEVQEDESRRTWATRIITANVVSELAAVEPERVAPYVPELAAVLDVDSNDAGLLTTVADVIGRVAEHDAELAADAVDPLVELLGHFDDTTVATAVRALGYLNDPAAVEGLRDLAADEDRDDDLRDLAEETAAFIEEANADA